MMEIKKVYVKTRAEFGKQCIFDICGPILDEEIKPCPDEMNDYIVRSHCHVGVEHSRQLALHEVQTDGTTSRNSGMFHFEGGWPKEINPRDEEATARFRRRAEKDDDWAPKLRNLFEMMESNVLQNSAVNIYEHYFDDMVRPELVQPPILRTVNVYTDPETPTRPVNNISWSPDSGSRIAVSYCFVEFGRQPDYSNTVYIWQVENPNKPYMALEPFCPSIASEFNPRDPSVLASGLMSGQVCSWDIRTGTTPVQLSHLQFSHSDCTNAIKWIATKSNTEFFSTSTDGRAMWWDTRSLRQPTEVLIFDLESPNEPNIDRAIGVSCLNFGPMVGTKFMFGMENGIIFSGSRKAKSNAEKLALRFEAHYGPVISVDCNVFNPSVFLSVGDWTARVWVEDTKEGNLVSTCFLPEYPTGGCWSKSRFSVFYVITNSGFLMAWDLLQDLCMPVLTIRLCEDRLTALSPQDDGSLLAIGNSAGAVYLVESSESLNSFDRKDRGILAEFLERSSKFAKSVDTRLREIKLTLAMAKREERETEVKIRRRSRSTRKSASESGKQEKHQTPRSSKDRNRKSVPKEKKKVKDDSPELVEAEERYFEIIEKEKERYALDSESVIDLSWWYRSGSSKRQEGKKTDRKVYPTPSTMEKEILSQSSARKDRKKTKKGEALKSRTEVVPREVTEKKTTLVESLPRLRPEVTMERSTIKSSGGKIIKKTEKKKRKGRVIFKLPCKSQVCKPKVCCWRSDSKRKQKLGEKDRINDDVKSRIHREGRRKKRSSDEDKEPKEELEFRRKSDTSKRKKGIKESIDARREGSVTPSNLMDGFDFLERRVKHTGGKKIRILREMLAPPLELTEEVKRARREIREAGWLTGKARKRYIVQKILESRAKQRSQKGISREFKDDEGDKVTEIDRRRQIEARSTEEKRKKSSPITTFDPCSPREARSITKEFAALLGGPPIPKSIEIKPEPGEAYSEELEAARSRVYPRISEFHSID